MTKATGPWPPIWWPVAPLRAAATLLVAALLAACGPQPASSPPLSATLPTSGGQQVPPKPQGKLSARLQMLADPAVSALDSAAQASALGLPASGPGSLIRNAEGAVLVVVRLSDAAQPTLDALAAVGLSATNVAAEFKIVTGYVPPVQLAALAALPVVENVQEELSP